MTRRTTLLAIATLAGAAVGATALAQPSSFVYEGSLSYLDAPVSTTADLRFRLFDAPTGGAQVGETIEMPATRLDPEGRFKASLSFDQPTSGWIEVSVRAPAGDGEFVTLSPRQRLRADIAAPPREGDHQAAAGDDESAASLSLSPDGSPRDPLLDPAGGGLGSDIIAGGVGGLGSPGDDKTFGPAGPIAWVPSGSNLYFTAGNVGIGTMSPIRPLDVRSNSAAESILGVNSAINGRGVTGLATGAGGVNFGVFGISFSPDGTGVFGQANDGTGSNFGVTGLTDSINGIGVRGLASSAFGQPVGVSGQTSANNGIGVQGLSSSAAGATFGVYGETASADGSAVRGIATSATGTNYGLFGQATSPDGLGLGAFNAATTGDASALIASAVSDTSGSAIEATYLNTMGSGTGVTATTFTASGDGVSGSADNAAGTGAGVRGESMSGTGHGVRGINTTGVAGSVGVLGEASASGWAGQFTGGLGVHVEQGLSVGTTDSDALINGNKTSGDGDVLIRLQVDGATRLLMEDTGGLTIGTAVTAPPDGLLVSGAAGIGRAPAANMLEVEGAASKSAAGDWLANSDRRIKTEIQTVTGALDTLDKVRLVSFEYTDEYKAEHAGIGDRRYLNVIAQEFAQVFPEHVQGSGEFLPDGSEILQVDTYPLTIYSAAAVQELRGVVHEQGQTIQAQSAELAELQAAVSSLQDSRRPLGATLTLPLVAAAGLGFLAVARTRKGRDK